MRRRRRRRRRRRPRSDCLPRRPHRKKERKEERVVCMSDLDAASPHLRREARVEVGPNLRTGARQSCHSGIAWWKEGGRCWRGSGRGRGAAWPCPNRPTLFGGVGSERASDDANQLHPTRGRSSRYPWTALNHTIVGGSGLIGSLSRQPRTVLQPIYSLLLNPVSYCAEL